LKKRIKESDEGEVKPSQVLKEKEEFGECDEQRRKKENEDENEEDKEEREIEGVSYPYL